MYGGHITDAWDRRTCNSYLSVLMNDQLFAGLELGPGFASPNPAELDYEGYITYVEDKLPPGVMKILWLLLFMFAFHWPVYVFVCLCVLVPECAYFIPYTSTLGLCLYEYILCHFIYLFINL